MTLNIGGERKKYFTFRDLRDILYRMQDNRTPEFMPGILAEKRQTLDALMDKYIEERKLFSDVDTLPNLRHDTKKIKRELLKYVLRKNDENPLIPEIQNAILIDDIAKAIRFNEMDFPIQFIFKKMIRKIDRDIISRNIPHKIKSIEREVRYGDMALYMERYVDHSQIDVRALIEVASMISRGEFRATVDNYLKADGPLITKAGDPLSPADRAYRALRDYFYKNVSYERGRSMFKIKEVYLDDTGEGDFEILRLNDKEFEVNILSGKGARQLLRSQNEEIKLAAKHEIMRMRNNLNLLREFIRSNRDSKSPVFQELCYLVKESTVLYETILSAIDEERELNGVDVLYAA